MEPDAQIAFTKQKSTSAPGVGDANARLTKQIVPWLTRANTQNRARCANDWGQQRSQSSAATKPMPIYPQPHATRASP